MAREEQFHLERWRSGQADPVYEQRLSDRLAMISEIVDLDLAALKEFYQTEEGENVNQD